MERKNESDGLDPTVKNLILRQKSNKIRRPPNAFMLFARERRRMVQKQNPSINNKNVSSILGTMWRTTSMREKEKYNREAQMLNDLHKERYPDYYYSPFEARKKKMKRMQRKYEAEMAKRGGHMTDSNALIQEQGTVKQEKDLSVAVKEERTPPNSEYVPNNPEYFNQQSSEASHDERSTLEQELQQSHQYPSEVESFNGSDGTSMILTEIDCRKSPRREVCDPCNQSKMGFNNRCFSSWEKDSGGTMPYFADHTPYPFAPSTFYNSTSPWAQPTSPLYYRPPYISSGSPTYVPAFHPYWNRLSPMNIPCCQTRDFKPFSLPAPYLAYTPDYHPQDYGYYDRPASRMSSNPTRFRQMGGDWNHHPNKTYQDYIMDELKLQSYLKEVDRREDKKESSDSPDLGNESGMCLRNRKIIGRKAVIKECIANCPELDHTQEEKLNTNSVKHDGMVLVNALEGQYQCHQQLDGTGNNGRNITEIPSFYEYIPTVHQAMDSRNNLRHVRSQEISDSYAIGLPNQIRNISNSYTITSPDSMTIVPEETRIPDKNTVFAESANNIKGFESDAYNSPAHTFDQHRWQQPVATSINDIQNINGGSVDKLNNLLESCFSENDALAICFEEPLKNFDVHKEFVSTNLCKNYPWSDFEKVEGVNTMHIVPNMIQNTSYDIPTANEKEIRINQESSMNVLDPQLYGSATKITDFTYSSPKIFNRINTQVRHSDENANEIVDQNTTNGTMDISLTEPRMQEEKKDFYL